MCNTQQVDVCHDFSLQEAVGASLLLLYVFSPAVLIVCLALLWPLAWAVRRASKIWVRVIWIVLLVVDVALTLLSGYMTVLWFIQLSSWQR